MKALNFYRKLEEINLVIDSPVKYSEAKKILFAVKDINYPVISKDDLIKMKQQTDRHQDMEDIRRLKILKRIKHDRD